MRAAERNSRRRRKESEPRRAMPPFEGIGNYSRIPDKSKRRRPKGVGQPKSSEA